MRAAAQWLAGQLAFADGRVVETGGHPVVRGEWLHADGAPTILVYGHYDVQPTGDLAEWQTPPFELTVDGDVIRGRGATDDKGPVYIVLKTAQAFMAQEGGLPLNVKFLFEGEEEIGSPQLPAFVTRHAGELAADLVISADGAMWRPGEPSLSLASKGLVTMDITVHGASTDLHSGRYGGTVANPLHALSEVLASLHHPDGTVAVDGFYAGIPGLTAERRQQIAAIGFDEADYLSGLGLDPASRCCWPALRARCLPPRCSSECSGSRRCSSRSRRPTRSCTLRTSSSASAGCGRGCGRGSSCGGCSPPGRTASAQPMPRLAASASASGNAARPS